MYVSTFLGIFLYKADKSMCKKMNNIINTKLQTWKNEFVFARISSQGFSGMSDMENSKSRVT